MMMAVPAKKGLWQTVKLNDGTEIKVQRMGDERMRFWSDADGRTYVKQADGRFAVADMSKLREQSAMRRNMANAARRSAKLRANKVVIGEKTSYTGQKKGLVILAQYTDVKFKSANNLAKFKRMLNEENFTSSEGFRGSVADYFKAQSGGIFELTFDVLGPVTLAHNRKYYGANVNDTDIRPNEMIVEAVKAVADQVNFADYDWDGDGEVDQVFVLYAGTGEADSYDDESVWPHMYELSATNDVLTFNGIKVNTYACSNELTATGGIEGIGCFCHEFSHCMGFPDLYDTSYSGWFGMSSFDLMCSGSYNGDSFCPAGYSAYEKMMAGWLEPVVLADQDVQVDNLAPVSDGGGAYILYNDGNANEYYMIENRQKTGWDSALPGTGLMVTHVDFDPVIWQENSVNTKVTAAEVQMYYPDLTKENDHQRLTIFHADNDDDSKYWNSMGGYYTKTTLTTDLYPYHFNDSLSAVSKPAAILYTANSAGNKFMQGAFTKMKVNKDGTASFLFKADGVSKPEVVEGQLFYESFDECNGTGGNDNLWSGGIASSTFAPDNDGWVSEKAYGANSCAKFGTSSLAGTATTPAIQLNGSGKLTFKAGAWNARNDGTVLTLSADGGTIDPATVDIVKGEWSEYEAKVTGSGSVSITFASAKGRFFLDEVMLITQEATGVTEQKAHTSTADRRIYTLDGRYAGTDFSVLGKGMYIINGKKIIK